MESLKFKSILRKLGRKNIAIIGHMGSGKSIIGKRISKNINFRHFDSDQEIVKIEGKSINDIFEKNGEKYFRDIEEKIIIKLLSKKNIVISLGGGSILSKFIRDYLKMNSLTIFLDVELNELKRRLSNSSNRPLLKNVNIKEKVTNLDKKRRKYYLKADIIINNTFSSPYEAKKELIRKLLEFNEN